MKAALVETALGIGYGIVGAQLLHHAQAGDCQDPGGWVDARSVLGHPGIELHAPRTIGKRQNLSS